MGNDENNMERKIAMAERRERIRIARIIHDELQQLHYAMKIRMDALQEGAPLETHLDALQDLIAEAANFTRALMTSIVPPIHEFENLEAALGWLVQYVESRYGLKVDLQYTDIAEEVDHEVRSLLIEVSRELLFNVVKHADVVQATVLVYSDNGHINVIVEDEGKGFDSDTTMFVDRGTGYGLAQIGRQVKAFGGSCKISSKLGMGTKIRITVPGSVDSGSVK